MKRRLLPLALTGLFAVIGMSGKCKIMLVDVLATAYVCAGNSDCMAQLDDRFALGNVFDRKFVPGWDRIG